MAQRVQPVEPAMDRSKELRRAMGTWLKQSRETAGLTQAELAAQIGLRYYSFVSQVENGIGRIPQDLYAPWADALGLDAETFAMTVLQHVEPGLYDMIADSRPAAAVEARRSSRRGRGG